ncbi:MAG: phosphatidate cytidylyltransferase [Muribaculaceae bacterium]|nr:phosphatidate cytidylyltransferase [Muribaculaceae bacterium]
MKNLILRSISGALYVALLVGSLLMGPVYFCALCLVFGVIGVVEFRKLMSKGTEVNVGSLAADVFAIICLTTLPAWQQNPYIGIGGLTMITMLIFAFYLLVRFIIGIYSSSPAAVSDTATSVFGVMYIGLGLLAAELIGNYSTHLVLLLFIFIWVNDTGAFLVGSAIGKHKLFERLSPKKSWEGFFGGLVLVYAVSMLLGYTGLTAKMLGQMAFFGVGPYQIVYILPAVAVVFSTWGDLFESMIKRSVGAKDSGTLIPGHGGLLDRIDSMLFVMPAAAITIIVIVLLHA